MESRPFATSCGHVMTMIFVYYRGCDGAKAPFLVTFDLLLPLPFSALEPPTHLSVSSSAAKYASHHILTSN